MIKALSPNGSMLMDPECLINSRIHDQRPDSGVDVNEVLLWEDIPIVESQGVFLHQNCSIKK
jgi:hypothetical protein